MAGKIKRTFVLERCGDGTGSVVVAETSRGKSPKWVYVTGKCPACGKTATRSVRPIQSLVDRPVFCCGGRCEARYRRRMKRHKVGTCTVCGTSFNTTRRDA